MSKDDIYSIVAYLRTLKPITNRIPERKLKAPAGPERNHYTYSPIGENPLPASANLIENGKYLANIGACVSCHTPKTDEDHFIVDSSYAGGDVMGQKFGFHVTSPNLTPDETTGIGKWTEGSFVSKFTSFRQPSSYEFDPQKKNTIMPWIMLAQMKEDDLKAIYAYLKTVKPITHPVEKWH